jgi:uncharacterized protein (TIGR03437 family)
MDANLNPSGAMQLVFTFTFDPYDSFTTTAFSVSSSSVNNPSANYPNQGVEIFYTTGTGSFNSPTGSLTLYLNPGTTFGAGNLAQNWTMTGEGNITGGGRPRLTYFLNGSFSTQLSANLTYSLKATGTLAPFGNVTMNSTIQATFAGGPIPGQATGTLTWNGTDGVNVTFPVADLQLSVNKTIATITGGQGAFAGASGSLNLTLTQTTRGVYTLTGAGSVTQPPPPILPPEITSVRTSGSPAPAIAQNGWIEIKGNNLVPSTTPAGGVSWSNAPEFVLGRLPTQLNGVSVTVDGKPAYVFWFCSAATTPACGVDQINVLTPLDSTLGPVPVVVTNSVGSSAPLMIALQAVAPSFLLFNAKGYVVATHADFSLAGPASLFPGLSTPASAGETIVLYGVGFGLPATALTDGSSMQSGALPAQPVCAIGRAPVTVASALVLPGLYQIAVTVPSAAASGDNAVTCTYGGASTPSGDLIAVR